MLQEYIEMITKLLNDKEDLTGAFEDAQREIEFLKEREMKYQEREQKYEQREERYEQTIS